MADKKGQKKDNKVVEKGQKYPDQPTSSKTNLSEAYLDKIKESFTGFNKISHEERISLYGDKKFLDQFRLYFKEQYPNLLDQINREDMPVYLQALEKKGFSIGNILQDAETLREEFKDEDTEEHVIKASLKSFKTFCNDAINNISEGMFEKFAKQAGFSVNDFEIDPDGRIKNIDDLYISWKKFVEKENISVKELQGANIEKILNPDFNPIERCMVNVALRKLRKEITGPLRTAFDAKFGTEVTIFSRVQNLVAFKNEWLVFLDTHKGEIDEDLAKKLDAIIVSNGDIKNELTKSGRKFDDTKGFSEWEQYFRVIFNKLATRQLFEEVKATQKAIDYYSGTIIDAMKGFPPYVNEIFKIYPFMFRSDDALASKLGAIDTKIAEAENKIVEGTPDQTKMILHSEIRQLKEERDTLRWNAYIAQLEIKDKNLAGVMRTLVDSKFNFSQLHMGQQQTLVDVLVKHKLADLIKRKAPELLSTDEEELKNFLDDLFDLRKMDVTIPTSDGLVHIKFTSDGKKFLGTGMSNLASPEELSKLENLPLNFEVQVTPSSEKFFEEGVIFHSIFEDFGASNGTKKLNDAYKVSVTKDGKTATGYLSLYSPIEAGKQWDPSAGFSAIKWYMYSSPVTTASDNRSLVTREGTEQGTAVTINEEDEKNCKLEVLEKKINLNGEALGALFAGFVLGQQSLERTLSPAEEEQRKQKMAKLKTFQDINQDVTSDEGGVTSNDKSEKKESKEKSDIDKFLDSWKKLPGYKFSGVEHEGFKEGAKFIIKTGSTGLPPEETGGDAWMWLEISHVDRNAGKFTVKVRSGETGLGKLEGAKKTLPMNDKTIENIAEALGDMDKTIYKMPPAQGMNVEGLISLMKSSGFNNNIFSSAFDKISWEGDGFKITTGEKFVGEKVEFFGYDEKEYFTDEGGKTQEKAKSVYYKAKYNSNGTVTITNETDLVDSETKKPYKYTQTMDYAMFILFVGSKRLHPKPNKEMLQKEKLKAEGPDEGHTKRQPFFSINNIVGFFKSSFNKVGDAIKKHDEERTEDLTDIALNNGLLFEKLGKGIGHVFDRVGNGLERAGMEYYTARDNRVWKKIERRQKIYEADAHFSSLFPKKLKDMISGKERPKDMYKIPALLLAIINKEKTPYSRSYAYIGKGHRVNLILGKQHQERYLEKLNGIMEDIRQNSELYGSDWTVFRNETMVKLEMKYLVDVIDGREHAVGGKIQWEHEKAQAAKWSREFAVKLDESMKKNFGFSSIESKNKEISKNTSFEFAEYEYQRHIRSGRTMSAFPFFKTMAEQAQTPKQWNIFHMYAVSGILSGLFWYNLDGTTKGWLKDIFRTSGILAGLWAKDPTQQSKVLRMLNIYTKGKFSKEFRYNKEVDPKKPAKEVAFDLNDFTMGKMENVPLFIRGGKPSFKTRWLDDGNGEGFSKFLAFESDGGSEKKNGKNRGDQKTIVELASDSTTKPEDKALLTEYLGYAKEGSQDIDMDIRHNVSAMESRPWAKSETIVAELMKYHDGEFEGKDSHEKGASENFWNNVKKLVPQKKTDGANVEFVLIKFFNWFGRVGFQGNERSEFVKRLVAIREMLKDPKTEKQAEQTLWYTINGTIIKNNSGGRDVPPDLFLRALDAFKLFFKTNIDIILDPSMVAGTMGSQYVADLKPGEVKVGDWEEYISHKDAAFGFGLQGEAKIRFSEVRNKYEKGSKYINKELYQIADDLEKRHGINNALDDYYNHDERTNREHTDARADLVSNFGPGGGSGSKNTGVKVKNLKSIQGGLIDNLGNNPKKKLLVDDEDDELILSEY